MIMKSSDSEYLEIVLEALRVCKHYKPKFGQGANRPGLTLEQFQELYQEDSFYRWFGLDNPLMYATHKAAGGMTSVYRQIGMGCERLFRKVVQDSLGLSEEDVNWSYQVITPDGKKRILHLDGCISLEKIICQSKRNRFQRWIRDSAEILDVDPRVAENLTGAVFEIRQGYKSKDSKRQNADISNAANAYTKRYLPCVVVLSEQIDTDILSRYRNGKWSVVTGVAGSSDPLISTYSFMRDVVGYDLGEFFERNHSKLKQEIDDILQILLKPGRK